MYCCKKNVKVHNFSEKDSNPKIEEKNDLLNVLNELNIKRLNDYNNSRIIDNINNRRKNEITITEIQYLRKTSIEKNQQNYDIPNSVIYN